MRVQCRSLARRSPEPERETRVAAASIQACQTRFSTVLVVSVESGLPASRFTKVSRAEHVRSVANQRRDALGPPGAQPLAELSSVGACVAGAEQRHLDLVVSDLGYDRVDAARQVRHQV